MHLFNRAAGILALFAGLLLTLPASAQENTAKKEKNSSDTGAKKIKLFKDDVPLKMSITTDLRQLTGEKEKAEFQKAVVACKLPDSSEVNEEIELRARGNFRREFCQIPSLMLNFKKVTTNKSASLGKLKMVCTCRMGKEFEPLVVKEYLAYKMYNLLTDMSYRVRLVNTTFIDSEGKKKPMDQIGYFIEDVDAMAKRNDCIELEAKNVPTEATNREVMTLVALFQFMIGNTDWSVPGDHNIKLIQKKDSANSRPYSVPYDFDFSGLVNASYATPDEQLGTTVVTERVYRGYARSMDELQATISNFTKNKDGIYKLVNDCAELDKKAKDGMIKYMDDFYAIIKEPRLIKKEFIDGARSN